MAKMFSFSRLFTSTIKFATLQVDQLQHNCKQKMFMSMQGIKLPNTHDCIHEKAEVFITFLAEDIVAILLRTIV